MKRLLAYHSVENIGIILLGLGVALLGRSQDLPLLTVLGLAGALLHVVNHGLFKALLFFSAGAVVHATGSREIDHFGGVLRLMPWTGVFFLGGAVAISGLPPLNGFVSEWFIYLGLFHSLQGGDLAVRLTVFLAPVLALIGALALACFAKVFGAAFLGSGRTPLAAKAHEAPPAMLVPMGVLLFCCAGIGLFPVLSVPLLAAAAGAWGGGGGSVLPASAAPVSVLTLAGIALLLLLAGLALLLRRLGRRAAADRTWGCGYPLPGSRMQYTAASFAQMLVGFFRWGLFPDRHGGKAEGLFPGEAAFASHTPDTVLDRLLLPLFRLVARGCSLVKPLLQHGISNLYLLYIGLTLLALLGFTVFSRG